MELMRRIWPGMIGLAGLAFATVFAVPALADKRVAMIIGNAKYTKINALENPINDAPDIAEALRKVGFDVIVRTDVDKASFGAAFAQFARKVNGADVALFYYAGHGIQYQQQNYLLPVDIEVEDYESVKYEAIAVTRVMDLLNGSKGVKIVILDACRDNPLEKSLTASRSAGGGDVSRGLARIDRTEGLVVAYATAPDKVAQDGRGRNSPFTESLVRRLEEPNLEVGALFRRVTQDVFERTNGQQRPEVSISLLNDFYFKLVDTDAQAWDRVRDTNDTQKYVEFIEKYPSSPFARDAKFRLDLFDRLRRENDQRARAEEDRVARDRDDQQRAGAEREARVREKDLRDSLERERAELAAERLAFEQREADRRGGEKIGSEKREAERLLADRRDAARREEDRKVAEKREAELREIEQTLAAKREVEKQASQTSDGARQQALALAAEKKAAAERAGVEKREADRVASAARENARKSAEQQAAEKRAEADRLGREIAALEPQLKAEREAARKDAERVAAEKKAEAERLVREEQENRKRVADAAVSEKKADIERVRLASLEDASQKKLQAESEKSRIAEICKHESEALQSLSKAGGKDEIVSFRKSAACPTLGPVADKALKDIATAEARACTLDAKSLASVKGKDIDGLRKAFDTMTCEKVRNDASARIASLTVDGEKAEVACATQSGKVTEAKSGSAEAALRKLSELQKGLTCERLRPVVAEALQELAALAPKEASIGSRSQILSAQTELKRLGCYSGNLNGNLNNSTKGAVEKYFGQRNETARETRFSDEFVEELKRETASLCPSAPVARTPARDEDEAPVVRRRPAKPEREAPVARLPKEREAPVARRPVERPVAAAPRPVRAAPVAAAPRPVHVAPVAARPAPAPAPVASARPRIDVHGVGF